MKTTLYPQFNNVFANDDLQGIFYPLCSVVNGEQTLHFVSHNGLWIDEQFENENNQFAYFCFDLVEGKYHFKGDVRLYKGYQDAQSIFPILVHDFLKNGAKYLQSKRKTASYIKKMTKILPIIDSDKLDLEYYLKTFYEFSINKLNYELNGQFGQFNHTMSAWGKNECQMVYLGDKYETSFAEEIKELCPDINLDGFQIIGKIRGSDYFTDGNSTVLCFNAVTQQVIGFNIYS